jgi:predicted HicB family RNase H-like nuclease
MQISHFVDGVRSDVENLGRLGGEELSSFATRLGEALEPALRTRLLEALDVVVAEANVDAIRQRLGLTLAGDEVTLTRVEETPAEPEVPGEFTARFALRLPDDLKARIEELAQRGGASTNSWIVRALSREVSDSVERGVQRAAQQLRGSGRS